MGFDGPNRVLTIAVGAERVDMGRKGQKRIPEQMEGGFAFAYRGFSRISRPEAKYSKETLFSNTKSSATLRSAYPPM